jgi:hypothetical protein
VRRVAATLAIALSLAGCGLLPGQRVPIVTGDVLGDGCILLFEVVDVVADSTVGTLVKDKGWALRWPTGYTAWRAGFEVEVRDQDGSVVLTTGQRYRIGPAITEEHAFSPPQAEWIAGCVDPCPDCALGSGVARVPAMTPRDQL